MLYIKFKIKGVSKYSDFKKLYEYMDEVRQPGFQYKEEEPLNFDWDAMSVKEMDAAFEKLNEIVDTSIQEKNRYHSIIPNYAHDYLQSAANTSNTNYDALDLLYYLEEGFEVDMQALRQKTSYGVVKFSTGNYPFGGLERFILVLKSFDLHATECFDGFSILAVTWKTSYEYETTELHEATKIYMEEHQQ